MEKAQLQNNSQSSSQGLKWKQVLGLTVLFSVVISALNNDNEFSLLYIAVTVICAFGFSVFGLLMLQNRSKNAWMFVLYTIFSVALFRLRVGRNLETLSELSEMPDSVSAKEEEPPVPHSVKVDAALECLHHCMDTSNKLDSTHFVEDFETLRAHYEELIEITAPFRPTSRAKRTMYRGYSGPRLEDHFIQHSIDEPFEKYAPIVPLYVHWTEVHFGRAGGGTRLLKEILLKKLRKDVIYFTVTTDWSRSIQSTFKDFHFIFASSKGDPHAHIILPHVFYYQVPGFDYDGQPIWNSETKLSLPKPEVTVLEDARWKFKDYDSYQTAPNLTLTTDKQPEHHDITFIGSLSTHPGRRKMIKMLEEKYPDKYYQGFFPVSQTCRDTSVESGASYCWRTFMLASDVNLCPAGTAPVSYRLYEALQMGAIPVYLHDYRGAFIPYAGTEADIRNGMGWAVAFDKFEGLVKNTLTKLSKEDIRNMHKRIMDYRESHYTPKGAIEQIKNWINSPHNKRASDVRCCSNPK